MSRVLSARVEEGLGNLAEVVGWFFAELAPELRGRRVLIKPNMVSPEPAEAGAITDERVLRAVVEEAESQGARVTVGDNPGGPELSAYHTAQMVGFLEAAQGCFVPLGRRVVEVSVRSRFTPSIYVSQAVLEADYLISVPTLKAGALTPISGAIKNAWGHIPGACKPQLHFKVRNPTEFGELLVDNFAIRPPELCILDGLLIMEGGSGTLGGRGRWVGRLLASQDPVALDATTERLLGLDPLQDHHLVIAHQRGLGAIQESEIEIVGDSTSIPDFQPPTGVEPNRAMVKAFSELARMKPLMYPEQCNLCGDCLEPCPTSCISLAQVAVIDEPRCIGCFACVDNCPTAAFQVPPGRPRQLYNIIFGMG